MYAWVSCWRCSSCTYSMVKKSDVKRIQIPTPWWNSWKSSERNLVTLRSHVLYFIFLSNPWSLGLFSKVQPSLGKPSSEHLEVGLFDSLSKLDHILQRMPRKGNSRILRGTFWGCVCMTSEQHYQLVKVIIFSCCTSVHLSPRAYAFDMISAVNLFCAETTNQEYATTTVRVFTYTVWSCFMWKSRKNVSW
jgi:hypothetical protein